jgi:hypothetical protein
MIMPRLEFEEPKGGPLSKAAQDEQADDELSALLAEDEAEGDQFDRPRSRDVVLLVLKGVTVAVVIALIGVVILLATSGEKPAATSPSVPTIPEGSQPSTGPTTSTSVGAIIAPEVHTQTTEIVPVPPPVTESTLPTGGPPGPGQGEFVRIGERCDTPGAYAFTESFEPVVCDSRGPGNRLEWRRIFR